MNALHDQFLTALSTVDPRDCRRDPQVPVWRLDEPGLLAPRAKERRQTLSEAKAVMLGALAACGAPAYLHHPDDPAVYDVKGDWVAKGPGTYRIPPVVDLEDQGTTDWLAHLGNWTAYIAETPGGGGWPDPERAQPTEIISWMSQAGVPLFIGSFDEDVSWIVALADSLKA